MAEKMMHSVRNFLPVALVFLVLSLLVRVYEYAVINERVANPDVIFSGIIYDLKFVFSVSLFLGILNVLVSFKSGRFANVIVLAMFSIALLLAFVLTQYFTITLIPLSSDIFGYSFVEIINTINASGGISFVPIALVIALVTAFIVTALFAQKRLRASIQEKTALIVVAILFLLAFLMPPNPTVEDEADDQTIYLKTSKTNFFIDKSFSYLFRKEEAIQFDSTGYPFMHEFDYRTDLKNYIEKTDNPPNIVLVVVEGLGRDFVGAGAHYGGFTPFLDSLTDHSLYWENCLSNAGRTFGALPSLLGSLPYGEGGFLSYAPNLPEHQTLISLLKQQGYTSNFFYGGNSNFDNMDVFLEFQGINHIMNEQNFPEGYTRMKENSGGFSWGFGDDDVFQASLNYLSHKQASPRLDIYLTLTTHEPFVSPDNDSKKLFDTRISQLSVDEGAQADFRSNENIYACLLYTDNALRKFIAGYQKRGDFRNTIFIITGDHRLIPVPLANRVSRFHVPLIIFSPRLSRPQTFSSIVTHSDLAPSLLGLLSGNYGFSFPRSMPFISQGLSFQTEFSSKNDIALIRNKNETIDYIEGDLFLSDGKLFRILPGLTLQALRDQAAADRLENKLQTFRAKSKFAIERNRVDDPATKHFAEFKLSDHDKHRIRSLGIDKLDGDLQFGKAQEQARKQNYVDSRLILRHILIQNPNHLDARILLARTFAWEQRYDTALVQLERVKSRAPSYPDTYAAMSDVMYWKSEVISSLQIVNEALKYDSLEPELRARKARGLLALGKEAQARMIVEDLLKKFPQNELAQELNKKFK